MSPVLKRKLLAIVKDLEDAARKGRDVTVYPDQVANRLLRVIAEEDHS